MSYMSSELIGTSARGSRQVCPLELYATLLAEPARPGTLRYDDGQAVTLPVERWLAPASASEELVADLADGPVLDVGCGPGRLLAALRDRGKRAFGIDVSLAAIELARSRGCDAAQASIFDARLLGDERWATGLLLDGNIGIGGQPVRLLRQVRDSLRVDGAAIVEVGAAGSGTRAGPARLERGADVSRTFLWARVDRHGIAALACMAGLEVERQLHHDARHFAILRRIDGASV